MLRIEHNIIGMCATNTYYAYDDETKNALIIDPAGDAPRIIERIARLGVKPCAVLLTHGHFDHILALDEIIERYRIPSYIGEKEKAVLEDPDANLTGMWLNAPMTKKADVYLKDGALFTVGGFTIRAIETPGHTPGGMCYYLEAEGVLFSGDTLFCESVGRSDFPGGSASALVRSIKEKLFILPKETKVYPGHGDFTTIGDEIRYNPYCI